MQFLGEKSYIRFIRNCAMNFAGMFLFFIVGIKFLVRKSHRILLQMTFFVELFQLHKVI